MIGYKEIEEANKAIRTTLIKEKNYVEVNQRLKAFRMVYPQGTIENEMLSNENGVCVFKSTIKDGDVVLGVGHAYEKEGSTFINKTSYIENCETSAVGRALGMCGFGIDTSICSADELQNAIANQDKPKAKNNDSRIATLKPEWSEWLVNKYHMDDINEISSKQLDEFFKAMEEKQKGGK